MIRFRPSAGFDKEAIVILLSEETAQKASVALNNKEIEKQIEAVCKANRFSGKEGDLFPLSWKQSIIILVGIGIKKELSLTGFRVALRKALLCSYLRQVKSIEIISEQDNDDIITAIIEAVIIGTYSWNKYKQEAKDSCYVRDKKVFIVASKKKIFEDVISICEGVNLTRDLVNDNADIVTSDYLEKVIRQLIKGEKGFSIEVLNRKELKAKGLGLILAVNQGSNKEPKLIIVKYNGAGKKDGYTALVGKGLTFDSGGLNLKPSKSIETMRQDMSGAAAVIGTLKNIIALRPKKNILFAMGVAENAIGSGAYKPGDVIESYSGKTVEIANTDAEGRLVLADAISYIIKNYKPERLIDIATLTGACIIALGYDYSGLMATDEGMASALLDAAKKTDDRLWRLPLYPELKDAVKSKIADIRNLGYPKGAGGTITAAEFLRQFVDSDTKWAHIDIAGTAFVETPERWYFSYGATGSGVRVLTYYLTNS